MLRMDLTEHDEDQALAALVENEPDGPINGAEVEILLPVGDQPPLNLNTPPLVVAQPLPPAPPLPLPAAVNPLLMPNDVEWEEIEAVIQEKNPDVFTRKSTINMNRAREYGVESAVEYFYTMFPMKELSNIVQGTNFELASKGKPPTSKGEFLKWLGIRLASVLERRRGSVRSWFKEGSVPDSIHIHGAYAHRFGMSATRFQVLNDCLKLRPSPATDEHRADK
jgi:hypothetical protein